MSYFLLDRVKNWIRLTNYFVILIMMGGNNSAYAIGYSLNNPGDVLKNQYDRDGLRPYSGYYVVLLEELDTLYNVVGQCSGILVGKKYLLTSRHCYGPNQGYSYRLNTYSSTDLPNIMMKFCNGWKYEGYTNYQDIISGLDITTRLYGDLDGAKPLDVFPRDEDLILFELDHQPYFLERRDMNFYPFPVVSFHHYLMDHPYWLFGDRRIPRQQAAMSGYGVTAISEDSTPVSGKCYDRKCKERAFMALTTGLAPAWIHNFAKHESKPGFIFNNQFITSMNYYNSDSGDSGGPFLIEDPIDNQIKLLGIISRGGKHQFSPGNWRAVSCIQSFTERDMNIINSYMSR